MAIEGESLRSNVCRAADSASATTFVAEFPRSENCSVEEASYASVRGFGSPTDGCTLSDYGGTFYRLDSKNVTVSTVRTRASFHMCQSCVATDTIHHQVEFSGGVDCAVQCTTCRTNFTDLPEGVCRANTAGGSVEILRCAPEPQKAEEGPVYTAELLAVGILVLLVGMFFILQSCKVGAKRRSYMSLNDEGERFYSTLSQGR